MQRRRLLQCLLAVPIALSTPKLVVGGLEMIASVQAEEKAPISEAEFERLMKYDTVDDILKEYGIGSVDDDSYQRKVYDSDKHVMVLFYINKGIGSKGLAVLTGLLEREFSEQFNVLGYKITNNAKPNHQEFNHVTRTYNFEHTPAVLFYKSDGSLDWPPCNSFPSGDA